MMDNYEISLQWFTHFLVKSLLILLMELLKVKLCQTNNYQQLELYKSIIRKFEKTKVYSSFKSADLADMQFTQKNNRGN